MILHSRGFSSLESPQPVNGNIQYLGKDRQFIIRHEAGADLDTADTVPLDQDAFHLHSGCQIRLRHPLFLTRFPDSVPGNILFTIVIIDFHGLQSNKIPFQSLGVLKMRNILDFSIVCEYDCVKDQQKRRISFHSYLRKVSMRIKS